MLTIVFASQKGGGGKTTLSGHLAVEAMRRGAFGQVAMVDTDPQASLTGWWKYREDGLPPMVRVLPEGLRATLDAVAAEGFGLTVVDTPPANTHQIVETCRCADLVVVPTKTSPHDLRAIEATVAIVESVRRPMTFVVNQAIQRARITADAAVALSQYGTVAPVTIHNRVDFQSAMIDGRTVGEVDPAGKSAEEIGRLYDYLMARMQRMMDHGAAAAR